MVANATNYLKHLDILIINFLFYMKITQIKVGVLIIEDDKILLLKEWSNKRNGFFWNIVKGTYGDVSDESILDCAIRECKEEAGAGVKLDGIVNCVIETAEKITVQYNFLAKIISGGLSIAKKSDQLARNENIKELRWMNKNEISELREDDFISKRTQKIVKRWLENKAYPLEVLEEVRG